MGYTRHLASDMTTKRPGLDEEEEQKPKRFPRRVECGACARMIPKPKAAELAFCKPCGELVSMANWSASAREALRMIVKRKPHTAGKEGIPQGRSSMQIIVKV